MNFNLSFWQETGLDPLTLGQPKLWIQSGNNSFLRNASNSIPSNGDLLNVLQRYNDAAFNPTNTTTTDRATWSNVALPTQHNYIVWSGAGTSQGQYAVGTTSDFSFMHQLNSKFTVYWAFKNNPNENIASSKFHTSTSQSTGNRGFIQYLANNSNIRNIAFDIRNDTASVNAVTFRSNYQYTNTDDNPALLYSFRCDLSVGTGQTAMWGYLNGILDNTAVMSNTPSNTAASFTTLRIGNRALGDGRFNGYTADYIIFQGIHDEATHLRICNYLKDKWRIA